MSWLLIVICGILLCQPTVNGGGLKFNNPSFKSPLQSKVKKLKFKTVFLFSVQAGRGSDDDYWAEDFDTKKNCQQEKKIIKLNKEVGVPIKMVLCRNYFTILQANDGTASSQCSKEKVSFLNAHK